MMRSGFAVFFLLFCLFVLAAAAGQEARAQPVPAGAEPARVSGRIAPQQAPELPVFEDRAAPVSAAAAEAPAGAEAVVFTLKSVETQGVSVYGEEALRGLYGGMIGRDVTLADIYDLAARLTAKYRNDGYILTRAVVPPQTIADGRVRLRVVEGFVDKVGIEGAAGADAAFLFGFVRRIAEDRPLRAATLEHCLLLLNDLPGIAAQAVLSPSPHVAGASDVTVFIARKPYDLFLQIDNRGSRYLGPLQVQAVARLNHALGLHEELGFRLAAAPGGREMDFGAVSWSQPVGRRGARFGLGYSVTGTAPGHSLSPLGIRGTARAAGAEAAYPLLRSRRQSLLAALRFDYLDASRSDNLGTGRTEDRLRVLRLAATYRLADAFSGVSAVKAELSRGIDLFNMKSRGAANPTRARGDPEFFKATMEISRVQRVTQRVALFGAVQGQKSAHLLLASEEFGVGGAAFGSAYDSSEITGEDGIAGRLELRLNTPGKTQAAFSQLYGFYDIGKVWDKDNTVAKDRARSLASAGAGLRTELNGNLSASLEAALPLTRRVGTEGDKGIRLFAALSARF